MATPIQEVILRIDNKDYIYGLQQANQATKGFANTTQQEMNKADAATKKVDASTGRLRDGFSRLRNALIGAAFVSFARSALLAADEIVDLSRATNIGVASLKEFETALTLSGGKAEDLAKAVTTFYSSVEEANSGSDKLVETFARLGVSFDELRTLNERDLLRQTIQSFEKITDPIQKNTTAVQIFGKAFRTVDLKDFSNGLDEVSGKFNDQERAILFTAYQLDQFKKFFVSLQSAFIQAIQPLLIYFGLLTDGEVNVEKLAEALRKLALILGTLWIIDKLAIYIRTIYGLVTAVTALKNAYRGAAVAKAAVEGATKLGKGGLAGVAIGSLAGIAAAAYVYKELDAMLSGGNPEQTGNLGAGAFPDFEAQLEALRKAQQTTTNRPQETPKELTSQLSAVRDLINNYRNLAKENQKRYDLESAILGINREEADTIQGRAEIESRYAEQRQALEDKLLGAKGQTVKEINAAIAELDVLKAKELESYNINRKKVTAYEDQQRALENIRTFQSQLAQETAALQDIESQVSLAGLYGDELERQQRILAVSQELRNKLLSIQEQEAELQDKKNQYTEQGYNEELAQLQKLRERAYEYAELRITLEEQVIERQRELREDWANELNKQLEDLARSIDPARMAANMFGSVISSIDNALTQFVEKGKFSFKDFARSLLRDMALIIARAAIMRAILAAFGMAGFGPLASAGASSTMAFNYTGPQFGGAAAKGGNLSAGKSYLVGEMGPELFVPRTAGTVIPNNQLAMGGGNNTQVTYNINAVDAQSFRSMVARDPQFLFNVTEVGRRSSPARRLA